MKRTGNEPEIPNETAEPLAQRFRDALERGLKELKSYSIPPCAVTDEARRAVETRLYNLPCLYETLEGADGLDALLISQEIRRVEGALESIRGDKYFPLIVFRYFQGANARQAARELDCDQSTVWRNRDRLLDALALRLMGTAAWETIVMPQLLSNAEEASK
ncbi:MAG: hypothetical protein IJQ81_07245 [Oscillibacter sp.]|nr:hypothetical protein [Oscillibacter sp.]